MIIAHRGASFDAPENTMAAFALAKQLHSDYIELDCHLSKDQEVIVIHDASLDRTTSGKGLVSEADSSYLHSLDAGKWFSDRFIGEKIPFLKEVLLFSKEAHIPLYIELKGDNLLLADRTIALINEMQMQEHVVIQSFDSGLLKRCITLKPSITYEYLISSFSPQELLMAKELSVRAINVDGDLITDLALHTIQDAGFQVNVYTIDEPNLIRHFINIGASGIITNRPDLALNIKKLF